MIGIKSYSQGVWDKEEVVTDKFHNIKQSVLVHCTAGEIDAVWYENEQMLKYVGKFPPNDAYKFTKTNTDVGFYTPRKRDVQADLNRSGKINSSLKFEYMATQP